jgi:ribosomal protein S19E (S16A)
LYKSVKARQLFKQVLKIVAKEAVVAALNDLDSRTIKLSEAERSPQQEDFWYTGRQLITTLREK